MCSACGAGNPKGTRLCRNCGAATRLVSVPHGPGGELAPEATRRPRRSEAQAFDYLREMLERQASQVAKRFPGQSGQLLRALEIVHREGVTLTEAAPAVFPKTDAALLAKGERILDLLARAEDEAPGHLDELELLVAAILDTDPHQPGPGIRG